MSRDELQTRLRGEDPGSWGHSMANMAELIEPILEAAEVKSLTEVGAFAGDFTEVLLEWAQPRGVRIVAVDPLPQPALRKLAEDRDDLDLIAQTSEDALRDMDLTDAVIIDGDHNYFTVSEELRWIGERAPGPEMPLLLLHDVGWPHARRDAFYAPERVPEEYHERIGEGVGVVPGRPGVTLGGLPYRYAARVEGGGRNGVLTALEDFLESKDGLRCAIVPIFFGLAVVWHEQAAYAGAVEAVIEPWDRNPILARLEGNRALNLATQHVARTYLHMAEERVERHRRFLLMLRSSKVFAGMSWLLSLRRRDGPTMLELLEEALAEPELRPGSGERIEI